MRGKDVEFEVNADGSRITPAYAGKRVCSHLNGSTPEDHPRLCGEKAMLVCLRRISTGSPPPMRGKETGTSMKQQDQRITPAYAGKRG